MEGWVILGLCGVCGPSSIDTKLSDSIFAVFSALCLLTNASHTGSRTSVIMELYFVVVALVGRDCAGRGLALSGLLSYSITHSIKSCTNYL